MSARRPGRARAGKKPAAKKRAARTRAANKRAPRRGRLWVIAAPSGAGKTSLVRKLLELDRSLRFSISYTTREPRKSEKNGRDYFFVDRPTFQELVRRDAFLEHAQVFDNWYGTSREHVDALRDAGHTVLLEIDWQGARQVRERARDARTIFVLPPNAAELERRLRARGTDGEATIQRRLRDSFGDMRHWSEFDHLIVNEDFDAALGRLARVIGGKEKGCRTDSPAVRAAAEAILATGPAR
ncbi:MAG TPA: guanylate kinase [Gammaproteobacteria bacterium]|nr:guanylate kinase [Gammaproteobacteria bacterium]